MGILYFHDLKVVAGHTSLCFLNGDFSPPFMSYLFNPDFKVGVTLTCRNLWTLVLIY